MVSAPPHGHPPWSVPRCALPSMATTRMLTLRAQVSTWSNVELEHPAPEADALSVRPPDLLTKLQQDATLTIDARTRTHRRISRSSSACCSCSSTRPQNPHSGDPYPEKRVAGDRKKNVVTLPPRVCVYVSQGLPARLGAVNSQSPQLRRMWSSCPLRDMLVCHN